MDRNASPGSAHSVLLDIGKKRSASFIGTSLSCFLLMPLHLLQHFQEYGVWELAGLLSGRSLKEN